MCAANCQKAIPMFFDDDTDDTDPRCASCGVPFIKHLGLIGTCKNLLPVTAERDRWKANHDNQVAIKAAILERPDLGDRATRVVALIAERDEARRFGEDAATKYNALPAEGRRVTCVYCGHHYEHGTPESQDARLSAHITVCDKHPMRAVEAERDHLRDVLAQYLCINANCYGMEADEYLAQECHRLGITATPNEEGESHG